MKKCFIQPLIGNPSGEKITGHMWAKPVIGVPFVLYRSIDGGHNFSKSYTASIIELVRTAGASFFFEESYRFNTADGGEFILDILND